MSTDHHTFETFSPARRGRVRGTPHLRLTITKSAVLVRVTRSAINLLGIDPKHGDRYYFNLDVDRQGGAIRLTPTDNVATGRMINPTNLQMSVGKAFLDWTGWGESVWVVRAENGALVGDVRQEVVL